MALPAQHAGETLAGDSLKSGDPERDAFPVTPTADAVARLGAVGAVLGLVGRSLVLSEGYASFIDHNAIAGYERRSLVANVLIGAATPVLAALVWLAFWRRRAVPPLVLTARLASPLLLLLVLPMLLAYRHWRFDPLPFLVVLGVLTLAGERLVRDALDAIPPSITRVLRERADEISPQTRRLAPLVTVVTLGAAYSVWAIYFTLMNHRRLCTSGFDLGIYDNLLYNALHGHFYRSPTLYGPDGGNYLANHAEFAMLLFLPFYALHPGPEILLVLQGLLFGMAAVPLFLFARTQIPRWSAVVVAVSYLLYAPLHGPNFYDFHWLPCAMFFHFWLYYAIAKDRRWLIFAMIVLLFAVREDIAVGLTVLGIFLTLSGARPRLGLVIAGSSVAWFVIDKFGIMMHAGTWWFAEMYKELIPEDERGYGAVIKTLLINPTYVVSTLLRADKVAYALHLFVPLALLPARRAALLLLASPGFFFTLLTTQYSPTTSITFQYPTHWIPYLFAATVLSLMLLSRGDRGPNPRRAAVFALAFGVVCHSYAFGAILQPNTMVGGVKRIQFYMTPDDEKDYRDLNEIIGLIPLGASVAATEQECPHVSTRLTAYTLDHHHGDADYLLVNEHHVGRDARPRITEALQRDPYGLVRHIGRFYLLGLNDPHPLTRADFEGMHLDPNVFTQGQRQGQRP